MPRTTGGTENLHQMRRQTPPFANSSPPGLAPARRLAVIMHRMCDETEFSWSRKEGLGRLNAALIDGSAPSLASSRPNKGGEDIPPRGGIDVLRGTRDGVRSLQAHWAGRISCGQDVS